MRTVPQVNVVAVCRSSWGREVHAEGVYDTLILLLGGYDKGGDASGKRQQAEIRVAVSRLREFGRRRGGAT